ncbi:SLAM family member 5-like [Carassius gibelio]|uniref:SLAM family member 5-like n=1 Tax=Carassius gibelio TaxID=101364 RepID=UPI002277DBDD|nr:SLAM family member 5-like [Carassius gibelio]
MIDTFLFFCLCSWSLAGVFGVDAVQSVSVTEGDSVSLNVTDIQTNDEIEWRFGGILIADINIKNNKSTFYNDSADERLRDRLKLDQTGSLIITDTSTTDSGRYTVTSSRRNTLLNTFSLSVFAHLPVPVITRDSSQCSSSSSSSSSSQQNCSLLCSVVNVGHVTLSWYKGNSLLSSISVSDLSISFSLHLEVEYQEKNSYSCVINNPIRNQTTHLDISEHCQPCPACHCYGSTEAVIRLALSVLVGVASVAVLVYECRSSLQQKKREKTSASNTD